MRVPGRDGFEKKSGPVAESKSTDPMDDQFQQASPGASEMADFTEASDPFALFFQWMKEAEAAEPVDPEAMALATVDADGLPNVRTILLKGADARGFVFYTNKGSAKGMELAGNPKAALLFYWKSLGRQNPHQGTDRARERGGGRCLFRHAASRKPDRGLRFGSVAAACKPRRA